MAKRGKRAPSAIDGSAQAKKAAHAVLEVLSGLKCPSDAAEALSVSLPRYYVLETRAIEGMVQGLEPREKGKRSKSAPSKLEAVTEERDRLKQELNRMRSLVRVAQRSVGLPGLPRGKEGKNSEKKGRKKRKVNRTRRVLSRLGHAEKKDAEVEAASSASAKPASSVPISPAGLGG